MASRSQVVAAYVRHHNLFRISPFCSLVAAGAERSGAEGGDTIADAGPTEEDKVAAAEEAAANGTLAQHVLKQAFCQFFSIP